MYPDLYMPYYFGLYHWKRHRGALAELAIAIAAVFWSLARGRSERRLLLLGGLLLGLHSLTDLGTLFKPSPWSVDRERFDRLAANLPLEAADTVVDLGCGTGRSIVGLAPHLDPETTVIGVDRFDDDVILGNSPGLAERNARLAGVQVELVAGDATALPLATDSVDVVTISQVLHDLPEPVIRSFLQEVARICEPDGTVGIIELPLVNDEEHVSPDYWQGVIEAAGMTVESMETVPWKDGRSKAIITATPEPSSPQDRDD